MSAVGPINLLQVRDVRKQIFPTESHFIPLRQLNGDSWVFVNIFFLRAACLCRPATNSVRRTKESQQTNDQTN